MSSLIKKPGSIDSQLSKEEIHELSERHAKGIIADGQFDLLKVYVELKRYETYLNGLIQNLKETVFTKAADQGKKSFAYHFAKIKVFKRRKYDYSVDEEWRSLDESIQKLMEQRKKREAFLKFCDKKGKKIDRETGEVQEEFELPKETDIGMSVWF